MGLIVIAFGGTRKPLSFSLELINQLTSQKVSRLLKFFERVLPSGSIAYISSRSRQKPNGHENGLKADAKATRTSTLKASKSRFGRRGGNTLLILQMKQEFFVHRSKPKAEFRVGVAVFVSVGVELINIEDGDRGERNAALEFIQQSGISFDS